MKYLFINVTAGAGSTGRIAAEQCRELMAQGHECRLAYGRLAGDCGEIPLMPIGSALDYRLHALAYRGLDDVRVGSYLATKRFLREVQAYDPDVIWLHNLHGYYIHVGLLFGYLKQCGKKIFWTLHDCWAFTGHCPYFDFAGCDRWQSGCHSCPQKKLYPVSYLRDGSKTNYLVKKSLFTGIPNMTLLTPSLWLAERVKKSFLGEYPIEVVPNQVDKTVFYPSPSDIRKNWGLKEDTYVILGVANVWEPRKGLQDFIALSRMLPEDCRIVLIGLNEAQRRSLPPQILGLPRTSGAEELARAYTAADVYVSASVEETFGMTVLEAISCGTKTLVYQDTACQEVAEANGGIAVPRGADSLLEAILCLRKETR